MVRYSVIAPASAAVLAFLWTTALAVGVHADDAPSAAAVARVAQGATVAEHAGSAAATTMVAESSTTRQGRILFIRLEQPRGLHTYLFAADADGSHERRLTWHGWTSSARWSPDGRRIAYTHNNDSDSSGQRNVLWMMRSDGSAKHRVLANISRVEGWSPDGRKLLVERYRPSLVVYDLGILRLADHTLRWYKKSRDSITDTSGGDWSWRTNRIAFARTVHGRKQANLFTMNPDFSHLRQLTRTPYRSEMDPRWAPPGAHRLAYAYSKHGTNCLTTVAVLRLADLSNHAVRHCADWPVWSPDASHLLMVKYDPSGETSDLIKVSLSTGLTTLVVSNTRRWSPIFATDWRPAL